MADPFSIIALVATAGSAGNKLTQIIGNLASAPDEILALSNELWNFQIVLQDLNQVQLASSAQDRDTDRKDVVGALLFQAKIKVDELNGLVNQWGKISQWGDSWNMGRRDRFLWLRAKKHAGQLQATLRDLKTDIIAASGIQASAGITRLEINIRNLAEQYVRLHNTALSSSQESRALTQSLEASTTKIEELRQSQKESNDIMLTMLDTMRKSDDESSIGSGDLSRNNSQSSLLSHQHTPPATSGFKLTTSTPSRALPVDPSVYSFPVGTKLKNTPACSPSCACPCHHKNNASTPPILQQLIGRLFLGYTGQSLFATKCVPGCMHKTRKTMIMTYYFPRWFLEKCVCLVLTESLFGSPSLNIKLRRSVSEMSLIFPLSRYNDVEGLRLLFTQRQASPDDVHVRGGWTALHFAVDHGCIEACRLLIECGADPEQEDGTGTTSVEIAWRNILHLRAPPKTSEIFSVLFPGTEFLQERKFSKLHKLVIGLEAGDFEDELRAHPQDVNALDLDGWTPLHWAARRGNHQALTLLLAHGADPLCTTGNEARNALHVAAQGNSVPCVQYLLQYRRGNTIIDIESRDGYGNTALRTAAGYNCAAVLAKLIQLGANINATDNYDEPGLLSAVYENSHEAITQLLNAGADYTLKTRPGNTLLHFAANESDSETLSLLTRARMRNIDIAAKNSDGLTASDLAAARERAPPDFMILFERLCNSIEDADDEFEARSMLSHTSGRESWKSFEDSVWFDAEWGTMEDLEEQRSEAESMTGSLAVEDNDEGGKLHQGIAVLDMADKEK